MRKYLYRLLHRQLSVLIRHPDKVVEIDPSSDLLIRQFSNSAVSFRNPRPAGFVSDECDVIEYDDLAEAQPDFIILNGIIHYERSILALLASVHAHCRGKTRLVLTYYSSLWKPLIRLVTLLGLRADHPESNWVSHADMRNFLALAGFELVTDESRVLMPVNIPVVSYLVNRFLSPLPLFRLFNLVNLSVARPRPVPQGSAAPKPSVSVVIPAMNEAGNIESAFERLPRFAPDMEIIFIEGHSTDNTWECIQQAAKTHASEWDIVTAQQDGKGKADAVRKAFDLARGEVLMILDADLTVAPEELGWFYDALVARDGELVMGSRLVYPMEGEAMRFINMLGNKFFAWAFSFVLGQRIKDTLCGTKVMTRHTYERIKLHREFFGDFDPFGDFDLIFGAARLGLRIVEIPIVYHDRQYGTTNISRWRHSVLLFRMLFLAARRFKFV